MKKGFTLVEMLVVVAVLAMVQAISIIPIPAIMTDAHLATVPVGASTVEVQANKLHIKNSIYCVKEAV